ncbi:MAG: hypothetical protein KBS75_03235 [Bacteroidales bacterium]|nr:hypothetical protein [Candidatus Equimonas faecalis]
MKQVYTIPSVAVVAAMSAQMLALSATTGGCGTIGGGGNASESGNPPLDTRRQDLWGNDFDWEDE